MTDQEVGSLAEELQMLAAAIGAQDPDAPDSVLGTIRRYIDDAAVTKQAPPDVERINLS